MTKQLNYKLIVSDFDLTLTNTKNEVPQEVISAINEYVLYGGIFAVCTGRILPCILPRVRKMGIGGLVVASQGCMIAEVSTGKAIRSVSFAPGEASEICLALEEAGATVVLYRSDGFYTNLPEGEEHLALYEKIVGLKAMPAALPLSAYAKKCDGDFCKVASLVFPEKRDELFRYMSERFGSGFDVTCSAKSLIEVSPKGVTKGEALKFLAAHYNIPMSRTVAVGDNLNDVSMIEAAGVGVAVANGEEELKKRADFVSVSSNDGAVAEVIRKFGYRND